ncbi:hypothetical protein WJR50_23810 [Catalinimonas sp. 4WD22]|uniref:hypothetical protein n=1 Tax=Catalinimonas locisalis TaxID=3133978 RepID=UPI0031017834
MRISLLFSCLFTTLQYLSAQTPSSYSIQKGEIITEEISYQDIYRFENFQEGTVIFANGKSASSKLNYNHLYGEIQFIGVEGDTFSIAPEPVVEYVSIGDYGFFYNPEQHKYLEVVVESPVLSIGIFRYYQIFDRNMQMIKGYVDTDPTFNQDFVFEQDNRTVSESLYEFYNFPSKEDLRLSYRESYYFIDKNIRFYPAIRSNLWKIFPEYRQTIRNFVNQNKIDFTSEKDLKQLVFYCEQLLEQ